ncbi:MAG: hypothetical protein J6S75_13900 [Thermoguttaceae bacterium]|nr:hypothetical protein [Thermoguttaceae bacterium]
MKSRIQTAAAVGFLSALFLLALTAALAPLRADDWGTRAATPAVVHPAILSPRQEVLSLRGDWDFLVDEDRSRAEASEDGTIAPQCWE